MEHHKTNRLYVDIDIAIAALKSRLDDDLYYGDLGFRIEGGNIAYITESRTFKK